MTKVYCAKFWELYDARLAAIHEFDTRLTPGSAPGLLRAVQAANDALDHHRRETDNCRKPEVCAELAKGERVTA